MLVSPVDGATTNVDRPTLMWHGRLDAAGYLLDFDGTVQHAGDTTGYTTDILAVGTYTWTVAAYAAVGHTSAYTVTWSFTVNTQSPEIVAVAPANGASEVEITAPMVVTFSQPIEASTFALTSSPDPGGWSVSWDGGEMAATVTHTPFGYWWVCQLTVTAATDLLGNPLAAAPYAWSFTTRPYRIHLPWQ